MRVKNSLSPYPILNNYGDDYIGSSFSAKCELKTQFTEVYGKIAFHLKNSEIEDLIKAKQAEYLVHIECPSTSYRCKISSPEPEVEFKLESRNLFKMLEIRTFIVLTQNINGFSSKSFHPDYSGKKFDLMSHQIIAVGTPFDRDIRQDDRDLESLPSVLQIVKLTNRNKGSFTVNTDNDDRILVGLAPEVYDQYARLGRSTFKATAFSLILLPALLIIIQRMAAEKGNGDMNSRHWFQVIHKILERNGYRLDDLSIENDSLSSACQSIFADPIARSFKELDLYSERV